MHYYVDGYNLLFSVVEVEEELHKQRDEVFVKLIHIMESLDLDVTIVFDATHKPGEVAWTRTHGVRVVYTGEGETADNFIIHALEKVPEDERSKQTVVTSDKGLARIIRSQGTAATVDVGPFLHWLRSRYRNKMRKRNMKAVDRLLDIAITTRVPPAHPEVQPTIKKTPEACFDYYHHVFSQGSEPLPEEPPSTAPTAPPEEKAPKKKKQPAPPLRRTDVSEDARWLRLFTDRLEKGPNDETPL